MLVLRPFLFLNADAFSWVGHLFTYVKTCERVGRVDFEQRSRVYNTVRYNVVFFHVDPDNRVIMESQCSKHTRNYS